MSWQVGPTLWHQKNSVKLHKNKTYKEFCGMHLDFKDRRSTFMWSSKVYLPKSFKGRERMLSHIFDSFYFYSLLKKHQV